MKFKSFSSYAAAIALLSTLNVKAQKTTLKDGIWRGVIVGRDGKVKEIHTGFSGKGMGQFYQEYVKKWNEDLAKLISEPLP